MREREGSQAVQEVVGIANWQILLFSGQNEDQGQEPE